MSYGNTMTDTIAAVATPPGEGGVSIVRISGPSAIDIAEQIFSGPVRSYLTHTVHFGEIINSEEEKVDEVLLIPMLAPRSYTGENTVEIHCHGGSLITRSVLDTVLAAGARAAGPGEFTCRAFINGKLDLVQAEAVQHLISARSQEALKAAEKQLDGSLSMKIQALQKELIDIAAILEAWVDFPEEGIEFSSIDDICSSLQNTLLKMETLAATFQDGKRLQTGISLCLSGAPNVGKSSLMNALLGKERAIVTQIPGTTRDLLEEELLWAGMHFRLIDTAGIRDTSEQIEQEGIRRSYRALEEADLVLLIIDASQGITAEDERLLGQTPQDRTLLVWNKTDLPHHTLPQGAIAVSAKENKGLSSLREAIERLIWQRGAPCKQEVVITNVRHYQALVNAIKACTMLIAGLKTAVSPEFLSSDMREILGQLSSIIGMNVTDEILTAIFSKFCIGK